MKDITNINLLVYASKRLDISYNYNGKSVLYAKIELGVVKNPFTDKMDVAVCPLVKNALGELTPLYSFEEDLQYRYCMDVADDCMFKGLPIPTEVKEFAMPLMQKKEFARKQADEYVHQFMPELPQDASTAYTRSEWYKDVLECDEAKKMLEEYYNSIKK